MQARATAGMHWPVMRLLEGHVHRRKILCCSSDFANNPTSQPPFSSLSLEPGFLLSVRMQCVVACTVASACCERVQSLGLLAPWVRQMAARERQMQQARGLDSSKEHINGSKETNGSKGESQKAAR